MAGGSQIDLALRVDLPQGKNPDLDSFRSKSVLRKPFGDTNPYNVESEAQQEIKSRAEKDI